MTQNIYKFLLKRYVVISLIGINEGFNPINLYKVSS